MNLTFKSLLGVVPRGARSVGEIVAAGVSVKKEARTNLSTSDKLKLAKAAREGGTRNSPSSNPMAKWGVTFAQFMTYICA